VGLDVYDDILRKITYTDDKISEQMWHIAKAIDEICDTTYMLPLAVPQCIRVSTTIGTALELFRALTDASNHKTRIFKSEIMNIQ
jgi:hypothetical protein